MSDDDLRALAEGATPGEWFAHIRTQSAEGAHPHVGWVSTERNNVTVVDNAWDGDAAFIAAANPTAVLALLDRLEAAEAAVERAQDLADKWGVARDAVCCDSCQSAVDALRAAADDLSEALDAD